MALLDNILSVEGTGQNPNSSAVGPGQFINSTWLDMIRKYRPDLAEGKTPDQILALRTEMPGIGAQMTDAYARENAGILAGAGQPVTPGTTYLAHFAGPGGAIKVLTADAAAPVGQILGAGVVRANPFLANMTAGDLRAWADRKMAGGPALQTGQGSPVVAQMAPALPAPAPGPPNAPASLVMARSPAPYLPPQPQQSGAQPQSPFLALDEAPIYPRQPDLTRLRLALQSRPMFKGFYS